MAKLGEIWILIPKFFGIENGQNPWIAWFWSLFLEAVFYWFQHFLTRRKTV